MAILWESNSDSDFSSVSEQNVEEELHTQTFETDCQVVKF